MHKFPVVVCMIVAVVSLIVSARADELPKLRFVDEHLVKFTGTGCDNSSANVKIVEDGNSAQLGFDRMQVTIGGSTRLAAKRLDCVVRVPVEIAPGWSIALTKDDIRLGNLLAKGSRSVITVRGRFKQDPSYRTIASQSYPTRVCKQRVGTSWVPVDHCPCVESQAAKISARTYSQAPAEEHESYDKPLECYHSDRVWSPCGGKTELILHARVYAALQKGAPRDLESVAQLDTLDLTSNGVFPLSYRRCK